MTLRFADKIRPWHPSPPPRRRSPRIGGCARGQFARVTRPPSRHGCARSRARVVAVADPRARPAARAAAAPGRRTVHVPRRRATAVHPEPTEHARFLIAVCAPLLVALAIASAPRWRRACRTRRRRSAALAAQLALVGVVVASSSRSAACASAPIYTPAARSVAHAPLLHDRDARRRGAAAARPRRASPCAARRGARRGRAAARLARAPLLAGGARRRRDGVWLLHAVNTDAAIANAVGRRPLPPRVHARRDVRGAQRPHAARRLHRPVRRRCGRSSIGAADARVLGKTVLGVHARDVRDHGARAARVFGVLRRVDAQLASPRCCCTCRSSRRASSWSAARSRTATSFGNYFGIFPLRYAGPFLLAWLTRAPARRARGARRAGAGCCSPSPGSRCSTTPTSGSRRSAATRRGAACGRAAVAPARALRALARDVAAGLRDGATRSSPLLTLVRAGALPAPRPRSSTTRASTRVAGFALLPLPGVLGLHLLDLPHLRRGDRASRPCARSRRAPNRALTGDARVGGVFGLGSGGYYVGRSHPEALIARSRVGAGARAADGRRGRRARARARCAAPRSARSSSLFGFGVAGLLARADAARPGHSSTASTRRSSRPNVAAPTRTRSRASRRPGACAASSPRSPTGRSRFVVRRGAPVAILLTTGHRVADAYGVVNVSPYTGIESLQTVQRVDAARRAAPRRRQHRDPARPGSTSDPQVLERRGFRR